jgi:serine/threonine-protein kinase
MTRQQAGAILKAKNITPDWVEQEAPDKVPGTVLETIPAKDARIVKSFAFVRVILAKQPLRTVPTVVNLDAIAAVSAIGEAGLKVSPLPRSASSDTVPENMVIGTDPAAGEQLAPDTEVTLILSTGPSTVELPNTVGMTRAEAELAITGVGCSVKVGFQIAPAPQKGKVVTQEPPSGEIHCTADVFITITVGA